MKNFRDSLKEEMKNPEFRKEWEALEPEFKLAREKLDSENENFSKAMFFTVVMNNQNLRTQV